MLGLFNLTAWEVTPTRAPSRYSTETVEDWSRPKLKELPFKVHCEPVESTEGDVERPTTIERYRVITPPGVQHTVTAHSRLHVEGFTKAGEYFHVVGQPGIYNTAFLSHTEFIVERVRG